MPQVVVYGAGYMGAEVAETILGDRKGDWELLGFVDDAPGSQGSRVVGLTVLGPVEWIADHPNAQVALGVGHPVTRHRMVQRVDALGGSWATVVDPSCTVLPSSDIGEGSIVFAGCVISSRARLGRLTYLNYQTVVSHDASLAENACVMTHCALSGAVRVGTGAFIGVGVSTCQGVAIGQWATVGAGAAVVTDIPALCVAVGVPAKPIRHYDSWEDMPRPRYLATRQLSCAT